jgi:hypothetical protein
VARDHLEAAAALVLLLVLLLRGVHLDGFFSRGRRVGVVLP